MNARTCSPFPLNTTMRLNRPYNIRLLPMSIQRTTATRSWWQSLVISNTVLHFFIRPTAWAAACSSLLLCACAGVEPSSPVTHGVAVPLAWQVTGLQGGDTQDLGTHMQGTPTLVGWWANFDDLLLSDLVMQALQANTTVLGAQAALRQARALRDAAAGGLWPTVGASVSAQRSRAGGNPSSNAFNLGLDASWESMKKGMERAAASFEK